MQHRRFFLLFCFLRGLLILPAQEVPIIPQPQQVEFNPGHFFLSQKPEIIYPQNLQLKSAKLIQAWAKSNYPDEIPSKKAPRFVLGLPEQDPTLRSLCTEKQINVDTLGEEAYHLLIEPNLILRVAKEEPGLLYAVQSLLQLLQANKGTKQLPCLKIYDTPAFAHRAIISVFL